MNNAYRNGPLPQWTLINATTFETPDPENVVWRLWKVEEPGVGDPYPRGWRLAPRENLDTITFIVGDSGLYRVLDQAGMRIAGDAIRCDPDGAYRQLGLTSEKG